MSFEANLSAEDLETTYNDAAQTTQGCSHYHRGAKILAPCCNKIYPCRFCHNDEESHEIDRRSIEKMLCMTCKTLQPIGQTCSNPECERKTMARYYCGVCKFLDDHPTKSIYHCADCGICRVRETPTTEYYHCQKCNMCLVARQRNSHKCVERATESNCPVCFEFMHTSTVPTTQMPCGHYMHITCFRDYARNYTICPVCSKSLLSAREKEAHKLAVERHLALNPTPLEYSHWKSQILCNDCLEKSEVPFNLAYHMSTQCPKCTHYNTTVVGSVRPPPPPELAARLLEAAANPQLYADQQRQRARELLQQLQQRARDEGMHLEFDLDIDGDGGEDGEDVGDDDEDDDENAEDVDEDEDAEDSDLELNDEDFDSLEDDDDEDEENDEENGDAGNNQLQPLPAQLPQDGYHQPPPPPPPPPAPPAEDGEAR